MSAQRAAAQNLPAGYPDHGRRRTRTVIEPGPRDTGNYLRAPIDRPRTSWRWAIQPIRMMAMAEMLSGRGIAGEKMEMGTSAARMGSIWGEMRKNRLSRHLVTGRTDRA